MIKRDLGVDTTIKTVATMFREDGRSRFAHPRMVGLFEFLLAALWVLAALAVGAFLWFW
jgi:hypothetical protein